MIKDGKIKVDGLLSTLCQCSSGTPRTTIKYNRNSDEVFSDQDMSEGVKVLIYNNKYQIRDDEGYCLILLRDREFNIIQEKDNLLNMDYNLRHLKAFDTIFTEHEIFKIPPWHFDGRSG